MEYFNLLNTTTYNNKTFTNIFKRFIIENSIDEKYLKTYLIKENQTLEDISYEEYEDESFWWLIAILNDIKDVLFDIPVSESILQAQAKEDSYNESLTDEENLANYIIAYDALSIENDAKRKIKVIKSDYITDVITTILRDDTLLV